MSNAQPPERLAEYLRAKIVEAQAAYEKAVAESMDADDRMQRHARDLETYKNMLGILEREAALSNQKQ